MLLAMAGVAALAFWDERRESRVALDDFAEEQVTLAAGVAAELTTRFDSVRRDAAMLAASLRDGDRLPETALDGYSGYTVRPVHVPPRRPEAGDLLLTVPVTSGEVIDLGVPPAKLLARTHLIEHPGALRVFVRGPRDRTLRSTDGGTVVSEPLQAALDGDGAFAWLAREDTSTFGLPARRAAAGLAAVDGGPFGRWQVAVVSSAERLRDRELRASFRLALGVVVAAGLVLAFGSVALHRQRRGLLLERELALSALARERDADLARAGRVAMMGTFAMGIAHEVGTPLGVIAGRGEQLAERLAGDERSERAVRAILEQTERIRSTIRAFLDVARGEQRGLCDSAPSAVLDGARSLVEHRFRAASVALVADVPADLPLIHGDTQLLQQALVNLLLNACDACAPGGQVEAKIRTDGEQVAFTVVDDGEGITPEAAARATEPFFTTKSHGAGLGLAIASEIVKLHRGSLSLRAASPRGTTASVILPVARSVAHAA
jgi:signal transduction histidine kinase